MAVDPVVEPLSSLPKARLSHVAREAGVVLRGKDIDLRDPKWLLPLLTRDELRSACWIAGPPFLETAPERFKAQDWIVVYRRRFAARLPC